MSGSNKVSQKAGSKERIKALESLLTDGDLSTQEELRDKLEKQGFDTTQSTISRDLRKLGAIRTVDTDGRTVYRVSEVFEPRLGSAGMGPLVSEITTNGAIIVIHTAVGSASLIARHIDSMGLPSVLGTIAGDDTVFVAPATTNVHDVKATIKEIYACLVPIEKRD